MHTILATGLIALAGIAAVPSAIAHDRGGVNWSVNVGVPGPVFYGPPVVYQPQAVYVRPRPVYVQPAPLYYTAYGRPYYGHPGYWHRHHHWHR